MSRYIEKLCISTITLIRLESIKQNLYLKGYSLNFYIKKTFFSFCGGKKVAIFALSLLFIFVILRKRNAFQFYFRIIIPFFLSGIKICKTNPLVNLMKRIWMFYSERIFLSNILHLLLSKVVLSLLIENNFLGKCGSLKFLGSEFITYNDNRNLFSYISFQVQKF